MDVDVLVAGGGPAGCATAVSLARLGASVLLVGGVGRSRSWSGESLPPGAGELVASIFGSDILTAPPHQVAYGTRSVWGNDQLIETDFLANPMGTGWQLDRHRFDAQLMASAANQGAQVMAGVTVRTVTRQKSGWHIALSNAATLRAHWLVDASGRSGVLVRQLAIKRARLDQQIAQMALLTPSEPTDNYWGTSVEAVAEGWWYTTPLPDGQLVLAYLTDRDRLPGKAERQIAWQDRLADTVQMKHLAGLAARTAAIKTFPADTSRRTRLYGEGWVAVGDAAITLDPLSSQGIVTGVLMGARAGPAIVSALGEGQTSLLQAWDRDYRLLWAEHQSLRSYYAHAEIRWPDSVYWGRRRT